MNGFTEADMSTAAANGFRDGLAAQPAAAQEAVRPACEILAGVTDAAHGGRRVWVLDGVRLIREDICVAAIDDARSAASAPVAAAPACNDVPFATVQRVVRSLTQCGVATPYSQEEQAARAVELIHWLCDEVPKIFASTPAAPGIDLAQFKDLIGFAAWSAINLPETDPRCDFIRQASELLALIDASPKGGICATCNDNGLIGGPSFYQPDEGGIPCPDCVTNVGVTDTQRLDWLESEIRHYGDGQTEPREAYIGFNWQQGNGVKVFPGLRSAIDAAMQATSAEVGS